MATVVLNHSSPLLLEAVEAQGAEAQEFLLKAEEVCRHLTVGRLVFEKSDRPVINKRRVYDPSPVAEEDDLSFVSVPLRPTGTVEVEYRHVGRLQPRQLPLDDSD